MLSAYIAQIEIWMDNYPSICQIGRYGWIAIRLNSLQGDMGGCCPSKELDVLAEFRVIYIGWGYL